MDNQVKSVPDVSKLVDAIQQITGLNPDYQGMVLVSVVLIVGLWMIKYLAIKVVTRRTDDPAMRYRWRKTIGYAYFMLVIISLLRVWIKESQSVITIFGFLTAGVAIALQDLVKSLAGWLFLIWRRPFNVGDRIQIGSNTGDVIDIRPFKFSLVEIGNWVDSDQSTGRVMHVPNSIILTDTIINYSEGFQYIWNEIHVMVTFESNWQKAKNILTDIAGKHAEHMTKDAEVRVREASKKFMIFYNKLTPIVYTAVKDSGVMLSIRYLIEPRRRRGSEQAIWEEVLLAFAKADDIDFAYPTQRFYNNLGEGKTLSNGES